MSSANGGSSQNLIKDFYDQFAEPNELLLHDPEGEGGFFWPVPSWETEDAVDDLFPQLPEGARSDLTDSLNERSTIWVRKSEWNDMDK